MTPVNESEAVQFSYRAQPENIFMQMTDGQCAFSSLAEMSPLGGLTYVDCRDLAPHDQAGVLLTLARAEAAYRPRIRPARPVAASPDGTCKAPRVRAAAKGHAVRPVHPAHLVIVSASRVRPARLSASQPVAAAITATRAALYPAVPASPAHHTGLRMAAHCVAFAGMFMSATQTAVAQQMLSLF